MFFEVHKVGPRDLFLIDLYYGLQVTYDAAAVDGKTGAKNVNEYTGFIDFNQ